MCKSHYDKSILSHKLTIFTFLIAYTDLGASEVLWASLQCVDASSLRSSLHKTSDSNILIFLQPSEIQLHT